MKPSSLWRPVFLCILCISIAFYTFQYARYGKEHGLILTMLDVGQGDSFLLQTPHNQFILIDTGATDRVIRELSSALPFLQRTIDYVFLSHEDSDHIGGYLPIHAAYKIGDVFTSGQQRTTAIAEQTRASFADSTYHKVHMGDSMSIDGVDIKVLWPDRTALPDDDPNTFSVVLLITYNNLRQKEGSTMPTSRDLDVSLDGWRRYIGAATGFCAIRIRRCVPNLKGSSFTELKAAIISSPAFFNSVRSSL